MRHLLTLIVTVAMTAASWSCRNDSEGRVPSLPKGEDVPTMSTLDVSTFVSDSGYTRYHITADVWRMYEDAPDPFWKFPRGLFLEQFDEDLKPAANVICDSATYFSRRRIWRLDGNVVMVNTERDSFLTQQLFWDQNRQLVYSDSFIHIVRADRIIEGYGFESNQNMTAYTVMRPTGIIPVNRPAPELAQTDSSAPSTAARRRDIPVRASQRTDTAPAQAAKFPPHPARNAPPVTPVIERRIPRETEPTN